MQGSKSITNWLTLGPVFSPAHQTDKHAADDGHPIAAEIIEAIDRESLDPGRLTASLSSGPSAGDIVSYGDGSLFPNRDYRWQVLSFGDPDVADPRAVQDAIHTRLGSGLLPEDPTDPAGFVGKHHALVFLLTYIVAPDARNTRLCVRSDDAIRVWLNGAEVLPLRFIGERDIDELTEESCAEVSLRQGVNILLVAVAETHHEWGFSARFEHSEGLQYLTGKPELMTVYGRVTDAYGQPLVGAIVHAFDKDLRSEQRLGEQIIDADGRYVIQYIRAQFQRAEKAAADLIVRVLDTNGTLLIASPVQFNAAVDTKLDLMVGGGEPREPSEFERMQEALAPALDGVELAELGAEEIAFLVSETGLPARHLGLLAQAHRLAVHIDLPPVACYALVRQGLPASLAPLLVYAPAAWRRGIEAAIDENIVPSALGTQLDAVIERLTRLAAETTREPIGVSPIQLRLERLDDTVSVLLEQTGADRDYVNETLNAYLRNQLAAVLADYDHAALAAFVQSMPSVDLAADTDTDLRTFMIKQAEAALANGAVMAEPLRASIDTLSATTTIAALLGLDQPLKLHPLFTNEANRLRLRGLLDTSPGLSDRTLQQRFLDRYAAHEGEIEAFWQGLRDDPDFQAPGLVDGIQRTLQLSHLTGHSIPVVAALQHRYDVGELASLRDLVHLSVEDWKKFIHELTDANQPVPIPGGIEGDDEESKLRSYVATIQTGLEAAFPTDFVAKTMAESLTLDLPLLQQIKQRYPDLNLKEPLPADFDYEAFGGCEVVVLAVKALRTESLLYPGTDLDDLASGDEGTTNPLRQALGRFFANASDFDIERQPVRAYLEEHADQAFDGITDSQRTAVTHQLGRLQRLFRVTPRSQQIRALLAEGLDSASSISSMPYQTFAKRMAVQLGGEEQAGLIYRNALQVTAAAQHTFIQAHQMRYDLLPFVMGGGHAEWSEQADNVIDSSPTLKTLFGSMDLCDCEHCRSMYSPAAYFVEILEFLNTGWGSICGIGPKNPLQVLLDRRPDLAHIGLNCENAMTPMPYVDLVNEVLEYLVEHDRLAPGAANETGDVPAEALKANPQYVIAKAYETLKGAHYPITLPFDLDIETVRVYLEHLRSSRYELMEQFLPDVPLLVKQRRLAAERLGLSPVDYEILTDAPIDEQLTFESIDPPTMFGFFKPLITFEVEGVAVERPWLHWATEAKRFLERTGLSYPELIDLLATRLANPDQVPDKAIVRRGEEHCELDQISLEFADGSPLDIMTLGRLNRVIRLWRKLGWSFAELDSAAAVFSPVFKDHAIRRTFLHQLAAIMALRDRLKLPLDRLLVLWGDIETFGDDSLYRRLFLNRVALVLDAAFMPKNGRYLASSDEPIWPAHVGTLLSAFRISEADLESIVADAGPDLELSGDDSADFKARVLLTLANVSLIYRYIVLAKGIRWPIADFIALRKLSGQQALADPDGTARFIDLVEQIERSGFTMQELLYLYADPGPEPSPLAPQREQVMQLASNLRKGLAAIVADNATVPNPDPETARTLLASVYDQAVADRAIDIVLDTAAVCHADLAQLPPNIEFKDTVAWYDAATAQLCSGGAITVEQHDELSQLSGDTAWRQAVDDLRQLATERHSQARAFFQDALSGMLPDVDESEHALLGNPWQVIDGKPRLDTDAVTGKLIWLLAQLLPYRRQQLARGLVIEIMSSALDFEPEVTAKLLGGLPPLPFLDTAGQTASDPLTQLTAIADSGFTARYFATTGTGDTSCNGTPFFEEIATIIDYGNVADGHVLPFPDDTVCARWDAVLLAPEADNLRFDLSGNTPANLWLDAVQLLSADPQGSVVDKVAVQAGASHAIRIEAPQLDSAGSEVTVYRQGTVATRTVLGGDAFLPRHLWSAFNQTYGRLHKAGILISALGLTADELDYLTGDTFKASIAADSPGDDPTPFDAWRRLADYAALRDSLPRCDVRLIDVFATASIPDATLGTDDEQTELLTQLRAATGWTAERVPVNWLTNHAPRTVDTAALRDDRALARLHACALLAKRFGLTTITLTDWANGATAQQVKDSMRAKYDDDAWPDIAKPLNDKLRDRSRDALLDYLLAQPTLREKGIDSPNRLYAHLLIDVEMDPCMMTSRLKQAIASVQLFVQRCLMNLEPDVEPADLDGGQWERWMKRYRVWEANRKVFLYPENWIEPELRDDKSPFFEELESELLQGDLTPDYIETVFLNYLKKLDDVARLDICAIYWEGEEDGRTAGHGILHAFGRTFDEPYRYYYRCWREDQHGGGTWSPWELLNLNVQSDPLHHGVHLIPVVFNSRLYLFVGIFAGKPLDSTANPGESSSDQAMYWEVSIGYTERRNDRWIPMRFSQVAADDVNWPEFVQGVDKDETISPRLHTFYVDKSSDRLTIHGCWHFGNLVPLLSLSWDTCTGQCNAKVVNVSWYDYPGPTDTQTRYMTYYRSLETAEPLEITTSGDLTTLFETPSSPFLIAAEHSMAHLQTAELSRFFYADNEASYFVRPIRTKVSGTAPNNRDRIKLPDDNRYGNAESKGRFDPAGPISKETVFESPVGRLSAVEPTIAMAGHHATTTENRSLSLPVYNEPRLGAATDPSRVKLLKKTSGYSPTWFFELTKLKFEIHYHPYACNFIEALNKGGIPELLDPTYQELGKRFEPSVSKLLPLHPNKTTVERPLPVEVVGFDRSGAYSAYNWELFFHAPLLIATRLMQDQRFEDARKWFHFIFDPTDSTATSDPDRPWSRYWKVLPFRDTEPDRLAEILEALSYSGTDSEKLAHRTEIETHIADWRDNPFQPHRLARLRLMAYQKSVVMKYIDNLIQWGDRLFRQDTIESINEATQLYVLAQNILGERPQLLPHKGNMVLQTYAQLRHRLDDLGNALVPLEEDISSAGTQTAGWTRLRLTSMTVDQDLAQHISSSEYAVTASGEAIEELTVGYKDPDYAGKLNSSGLTSILPSISGITADCSGNDASCGLYFCVPQNDALLEYWNRVEDRLFKIRHCMNIEGMVRELSLYQPPIDPALLVLAATKGIDIDSVLDDLSAPLPYHRFGFSLQKALELCAEVKSLGAALLSTLEKKDAEALAKRRATDERLLLEQIRRTRQQQVDEATANINALNGTIAALQPRKAFYAARVKEAEENKRLSMEDEHLENLEEAQEWQEKSQVVDQIAGELGYMPNFNIAGLCSGTSWGSSNLIAALGMVSRSFSMMAARHSYHANRSSILAQWVRRADDWQLQHDLAVKEDEQLHLQLEAANLRQQIAQSELNNHDNQIANATATEEFLRDKFTNEELYGWMKGRIAEVYFQTYKLAYDLAKRAEKAYRYENGLSTSDYIRFGYWDSTRDGLLAGEQLHHNLKRMETAHLADKRREYELTKHISLLQVAPLALIELRATGRCRFDLPEELFDLDVPGHYFRRIKQVALTIPCVTGPYSGVHCTLSLLKSRIRIKPTTVDGYAYDGLEDPTFTHRFGTVESIVTSSGQNDSGLFETNLHDERWLPFEGAGIVSTWQLSLPADPSRPEGSVPSQFDYDTISDIVLHIRYTAREGGEGLASRAAANLREQKANLPRMRIFSVRAEFPTAWAQFRTATASSATLRVPVRYEHFPFWSQDEVEQSDVQIRVFVKPTDTDSSAAITLNEVPVAESYGGWLTAKLEEAWKGNEDIVIDVAPNALDDVLLAADWGQADEL